MPPQPVHHTASRERRGPFAVVNYTNLNLNYEHMQASFPLWRKLCRRQSLSLWDCLGQIKDLSEAPLYLAAVNDALHRLPPRGFARTKNPLCIYSFLD